MGRAGHSSPVQGPAPSPAAPCHHPHGLVSSHLVSPVGTLEGLTCLYPVQLTQATPMGWFWGVTVPSASPPFGWSRRQIHPCPLPRVCVSPAHGGQARVACPLNGLQQEQVLGKAQWAGSCRCKGSSSAPLIRLRYSRHRRGRSPRRCHSADAAPLTARGTGTRYRDRGVCTASDLGWGDGGSCRQQSPQPWEHRHPHGIPVLSCGMWERSRRDCSAIPPVPAEQQQLPCRWDGHCWVCSGAGLSRALHGCTGRCLGQGEKR